MNVTSEVSTNAVPIIHNLAQQAGFQMTPHEIEAGLAAAGVAVRYLHLEGPSVRVALASGARQVFGGAAWIVANGGVISLAKRFMGWTANSPSPRPSPQGEGELPAGQPRIANAAGTATGTIHHQ